MASIRKETDSQGNIVYKVQASAGRGRRVKRSWRPEPGWSQRTIERELQKFCANLENELADGTVSTRKEKQEQARQAELERARLKTFQEYALEVFLAAKEVTLAKTTFDSYKMFLQKHIFPIFGGYLLENVTPAMLNRLILSFQKNGYALSSSKTLYIVLNGVFTSAFRDGSIKENPMLRVTPPRQKKDGQSIDTEPAFFTPKDMQYIFQCLENESLKWRAFVHVIADSGCRRGEAVALRWSDINWRDETISINKSAQYVPGSVYVGTPKSGHGRIVDIGSDTLALLKQLQQEQAQSCLSMWCFTQDGTAEMMHPQSPTRFFKKMEKKYGIVDFHPHKLRHSSASIALLHGADLVSVSERLGHADTAITLRTYSHSNAEGIRRAGQAVRDALKAQGQ